jgi:sodium/hydrogen antiporter
VRLRHHHGPRRYHEALHRFNEELERLSIAALLVLFGGALDSGVLSALTWEAATAGLLFLLLVRPAAGLLGLVASDIDSRRRAAIAFFGIRGMGSISYVAYGLNQAEFADPATVWAIVALSSPCP